MGSGSVRRMVCLCGSMRYQEALQDAAVAETLAGHLVLMPHVNLRNHHRWDDEEVSAQVKADLDALHRAKIDRSDEVVIVCPDGYLGDSTRAEIAYAHQSGKPVRAWPESSTSSVVELLAAG